MSNIDLEDPKAKQDMLDAVREICKEYAKMDEARDQVKEIIGAILERWPAFKDNHKGEDMADRGI